MNDEPPLEILPPPLPARLFFRLSAFALDVLLSLALILLLAHSVLLPTYYPEAPVLLGEYMDAKNDGNLEREQALLTQLTPAVALVCGVMLAGLWLYFSLSEMITQGSSLGKRVFGLSVVKQGLSRPPHFIESFVRGGIKSLCFFVFFLAAVAVLAGLLFGLAAFHPIYLLAINYLMVFFTAEHKAGHDLLVGTAVVEPSNPTLLDEIV